MREPSPYVPFASCEYTRSALGGMFSMSIAGRRARTGRPCGPPVTNEPFIAMAPGKTRPRSLRVSPARVVYENVSVSPAKPSGVARLARRSGCALLFPSSMYATPAVLLTCRGECVNLTSTETAWPARSSPPPPPPGRGVPSYGILMSTPATAGVSGCRCTVTLPPASLSATATRPEWPNAAWPSMMYAGLSSAWSRGDQLPASYALCHPAAEFMVPGSGRGDSAARATAASQTGPRSGGSM